jgi:hypothetical protein
MAPTIFTTINNAAELNNIAPRPNIVIADNSNNPKILANAESATTFIFFVTACVMATKIAGPGFNMYTKVIAV